MANKPHKHAELIKAWADGAVIQYKTPPGAWVDITGLTGPCWYDDTEYRIKSMVSISLAVREFHDGVSHEMTELYAACCDRRTPYGDVVSQPTAKQAVHYRQAVKRVAELVKEAQAVLDLYDK